MNKFTASEKSKLAGLSGLTELSRMTGRSTTVLNGWNDNFPHCFEMVLFAARAKKNGTFEYMAYVEPEDPEKMKERIKRRL